MACRIIQIDGVSMIACGPKAKAKRCKFCKKPAVRLCDSFLGVEPDFRFIAKEKTCDAPICDDCAFHVDNDVDLCPDHWPVGGEIVGDEGTEVK